MSNLLLATPDEITKFTFNREAWLSELARRIEPRICDVTEKPMPMYRISVGFPSRNALSTKRQVIGQCWDGFVNKNGDGELFISPMIDDNINVANVVAHELIHNNVGCKHQHRAPFSRTATAIGLIGKPTATVAGPVFTTFVKPILKDIGPYPHTAMAINKNRKVAPTALRKVECLSCGYLARITRKWIEEIGYPICPCSMTPMVGEV